MAEPLLLPIERVRRNRLLFALTVAPFLAVMAFLAVLAALAPLAVAFGCAVFIAMIAVAIAELPRAFWNQNPRPRFEPGDLRVDDEGVRLLGGAVRPKRDFVSGYLVPRAGTFLVRLQLKGKRFPIELRVPDEASGRRLLGELGLDASQMVVQFPSVSRALATRGGIFFYGLFVPLAVIGVAAAIGLAVHPLALATVVPLLGVLAIRFVMAPTEISVGSDGIVSSWYRRRRFVGYDQIASIEKRPRTTWLAEQHVIVLTSGEEIVLPDLGGGVDDSVTRSLVRRIEDAREAFDRGEVEAAAAAMHRGDRDVRAWISSLRALGSGASADHRVAPVEADRLWRVVEDPSSRAVDRAAAAVALTARADASERRRLEAVSEATAAPRLRIAFEAAARGDEAELEAALAEIDPPKARAAIL